MVNMMNNPATNICPVCGYGMSEPPRDYNICPSCGTEFGVNDVNSSIPELRAEWLQTGPKWWSTTDPRPENWNPFTQLANVVLVSTTVISTGAAFDMRTPALYPAMVSATGFQVEPTPDYFDWAGRAWGHRRSEDKQPSLV